MRVAFFTAGTTGAGHVMRGLAVARALERRGFRGELRSFGPTAARWLGPFEPVAIDESELRSPERASESALARTLARYAPDLLLVDMFWAPLLHVLPLLRCEAWLLLRSFPKTWLVGPPGHAFDVTQYARRISIEPIADAPEITDRIDPVVVLNPDERRPKGALRERLAIAGSERIVAVVQNGEPNEASAIVPAIGRGARLVTFDPNAPDAFVPAAAWLEDADAIHAGAGYNSFWEAQWLGHAARTTFTAFVRPNDDQSARARLSAAAPKANGADTLAQMIAGR